MTVTFQQAEMMRAFPMDGKKTGRFATRRVQSMKKMREMLAGKKNMRKS